MRIIEQLCAAKTGDPADCEDKLVATDDYIAVIDGATSKTAARFQGKTGGQVAAELIARLIEGGTLGADTDSRAAANSIQTALCNYARMHRLEEKGIHLCASAVIYSAAKQQIWTVGDCQFLLDGSRHTFYKKTDAILAETRALAVHMLLQAGRTEADLMRHDEARDMITPALKMQQYLENSDDEYGYSVFSSRGTVQGIAVTDVPSGAEVVLASDGYPELFPTLAESESRLAGLLRADPLCYKLHKSTKGLSAGNTHFDDRTYVRFIAR